LFGDPARLRIMLALNSCEMCVCGLAALLESTSSAVSHQLRLLRTAGLVHGRLQRSISGEFTQERCLTSHAARRPESSPAAVASRRGAVPSSRCQ
jgi:DNA-binding transcriptional ArsR family regulator